MPLDGFIENYHNSNNAGKYFAPYYYYYLFFCCLFVFSIKYLVGQIGSCNFWSSAHCQSFVSIITVEDNTLWGITTMQNWHLKIDAVYADGSDGCAIT